MKKSIKVLTGSSLISLFFTVLCFFLPFLTFKDYKPISGIKLIITLFQRIELEKVSQSISTLVFRSESLPLTFSFILFLVSIGLVAFYIKSNNRHILTAGVATVSIATIMYGLQLSNSQTSISDFFGKLLVSLKYSDGSQIFKTAEVDVLTGLGARLLVIFAFISLFCIISVKLLERSERLRNERIQTPWSMALKQFTRNKLALVGIFILALLAIFCFFGPVFSKFALLKTDIMISKEKPSLQFIFGSDSSGRDIFTRLMYGGRISMTVGFVAVLLEVFIGALIGGIAGYYGGKIDNLLMRVVDMFLSLPFLPVVIILGAVMSDINVPPEKRIFFVMLIIGLLGWPVLARLVRGQILSLREQEYMVAAEALGLRDRHKIVRHLIPNVIPNIIVTATLGVGDAIMLESALSFLGIGVAMPFPSWGNIVQAVRDPNDFALRPWLWIPAGIFIFVTVLTINFVGDGLRDAFDPKMKK